MIRLALLRHGHTAWNRAGRIQGRTDVPLDPHARSELARLSLPAEWTNAALCASPLARARETAQLIAGRPPRTDDALIEMDWGRWEGQEGAILRPDPSSGYRDIEDWGWDFRPPGGETPDDLRGRLSPWIAGLHEDTVAVCHIGIMRVLLAMATGWAFCGPAPFQIKRNRLYVLEVTEGALRVAGDPVRLKVPTE